MKIVILAVGHLKEDYWRAACAEYAKRISAYAKVEIIEVNDLPAPENSSFASEEQIKTKEDEKMLARLKPGDFLCALDLGKEEPDSLAFSRELEGMLVKGGSTLYFAIGGSLGLSQEVKKRANVSLSLSRLTFPHQMTRVILLEQIYRSFKILRHEPYHK